MRLGDLLRARAKTDGPKQHEGEDLDWRSEVQSILIDEVRQNPFQPRRHFTEAELKELAASISEHGILHPVVVRPSSTGYELVVGERRLRAAMILEWERIPAIVRDMSDAQMAEIALIENIQRQGLGLFEEVEALSRLVQEFDYTQEQLAQRLGKSQSFIANKLRLLRLSDKVRDIISREMLSERHARALLALKDEQDQLDVLRIVVEKGLNVKETEALIAKRLAPEKTRPKDRQTIKGIYKDYRLLRNSVKQLVDQMKAGGAKVELAEMKEDDFVEIRIRIDVREPESAGKPHVPRQEGGR